MSRFPKIPLVTGDTDDDASIHLHRRVGPARPLPLRNNSKTEQHILQLLSEDDETFNSPNFNQHFELFKKTGSVSAEEPLNHLPTTDLPPSNAVKSPKNNGSLPDADDLDENFEIETDDFDENTEVETENPPKHTPALPKKPKEPVKSAWKSAALVAVTQLVLFVVYFTLFGPKKTPDVSNLQEINFKFNSIESNLQKTHQDHLKLVDKQEFLEKSYNELNLNLGSKFQTISQTFKEINENVVNSARYANLLQEFQDIRSKVDNLALISQDSDFEVKLNSLNEKLSNLQEVNENIEVLKDSITEELLDALPQRVPVYFKNNQIQFVPEFSKFLFAFIDSYMKEKPQQSWKQFLQQNKESLAAFVNKILQENHANAMGKSEFESLLKNAINANNKIIFDKFNALIDDISVNSTNISLPTTSYNNILLDNLIEIFAKGAVSVNYADYKLGARILGFLTSAQRESKSVGRKIVLGWYDFLINSSPTAKDLKYNANNALIDGGNAWNCGSNKCSIGIRLFSSVILTDLIFKNVDTKEIRPANLVAIYVKPKTRVHHDLLTKYLKDYKVNFKQETSSKYLKKFIKVKETSLDPHKPISHVTIPKSLINLRIPVRDIYIELNSENGPTGISNIKAYGVTEYNAFKYGEEFDLLIDNLKNHHEDHIMIADEYDYDAPILGSE